MAEKEVTIDGETHKISGFHTVIATQNPNSHLGTFPLVEAQLDRFMMTLVSDYGDELTESAILDLAMSRYQGEVTATSSVRTALVSQEQFSRAVVAASRIKVSNQVKQFITTLATASRQPFEVDQQLPKWISEGVSPRASIDLLRASMVNAWLNGRDEVAITDILYVVKDVYRNRMTLSPEAKLEQIGADQITDLLVGHAKKKIGLN